MQLKVNAANAMMAPNMRGHDRGLGGIISRVSGIVDTSETASSGALPRLGIPAP